MFLSGLFRSSRRRSQPTVNFQFMSDLHLEVGQQYSEFNFPQIAPYLILAGDIGRLTDYHSYLTFLQAQCERFERVFLVLGIHEFYGGTREEGLRAAKKFEQEPALGGKLVLLNQTRFDLDGYTDITILGCSLHSAIPPDSHDIVRMKINDFQRIVDWTVEDHNAEHESDLEWLCSQIRAIRADDEMRASKRLIAVVTHYAPCTTKASAPEHTDNPWNSAFGTDLFGPDSKQASVLSNVGWWIFGHTHYTTTFTKGNVSSISNQRGYVFPKALNFVEPAKPSLYLSAQSIIQRLIGCPSAKQARGSTFDVKKAIQI